MNTALREPIMLAAMEGDLARLLALGRDALGRPLLLGDPTLNVLGWSGPPEMPTQAKWEDFIHAGIAPKFKWAPDLFEANSQALPYEFSVCWMARPEGGFDGVVDIEMTDTQAIHLILSGCGQPALPRPEGDLLGLLCLAIRNCVNNRAQREPYERFSSEHLLLQLIRNKKFDEPLLRYHAHTLGMDTEGLFALLVLDLKDYQPQHSSIATIRGQLEQVVGVQSVIDGEQMVFLVRYDNDDPLQQRQFWLRVAKILAENKLFGVFSRSFYRLGDFHHHYTHTLDVLKLRFCAAPREYLVSCDAMSVYVMISALHDRDAPAFSPHPIIRRLMQSDQDRKTSYTETLSAYLRHSQKPMPTCAELHIHRNTLDYRLRRIEELTGLDWADGELMFRLYLSLCTIRYDQIAGNRPALLF